MKISTWSRLGRCSATVGVSFALLWVGTISSLNARGADPPAAKEPATKTPTKKKTAKRSDAKPAAPKARVITVAGNQISLNIRHWPLLGRSDAKYVFVEMFDYTCPYCRATHQAVRGAMEHFGSDLAIIALPVPLDAACNRTVGSTATEHAEACEIAKTAVAVWRVSRKQFAPFHSWLFEQARTAAEARQHAAELVGEKALQDELSLPHAANYIAKHIELYERAGSGSLPKLLFLNSSVSGSVDSANTLIEMITRAGGAPQ
jgi:protein-disulfide isomerase